MTSTDRTSLATKVFFALVIIGLGAAGFGAIKTYQDKSQEGEALEQSGVEVDADVMSVTEFSGRRSATYTELRVSYDPVGPRILEFAEVQDCSSHRYEPGLEVVRVVYLPDDPDIVRLAACRSSFDSDKLPGILGVAFIGFALFMLWRLRRLWTS